MGTSAYTNWSTDMRLVVGETVIVSFRRMIHAPAGANVLCLVPDKDISIAENTLVNERLIQLGFKLITLPYSEIIKSGGSVRCDTLLIRQTLDRGRRSMRAKANTQRDETSKVAEVTTAASRQHGTKNAPATWGVADIERLIRSVMAALIGLGLTGLFAVVVLIVLFVAVTKADGQAAGLLNTVLALMATTLGGVTGYVFGRHTARSR